MSGSFSRSQVIWQPHNAYGALRIADQLFVRLPAAFWKFSRRRQPTPSCSTLGAQTIGSTPWNHSYLMRSVRRFAGRKSETNANAYQVNNRLPDRGGRIVACHPGPELPRPGPRSPTPRVMIQIQLCQSPFPPSSTPKLAKDGWKMETNASHNIRSQIFKVLIATKNQF